MKVLLTGASGYIGKRLLPALVAKGHSVVCLVRDRDRFQVPAHLRDHVQIVEGDLLEPSLAQSIPDNIDGAYYLVHSMSSTAQYDKLESACANNFRSAADEKGIRHVVYLSGLINETGLSKHLRSRRNVEVELGKGNFHLTTLRAGLIIGSGSASFEIVRDLIEKLPLMVAPKWVNTKTQPIAVQDVVQFLLATLFNEKTYDQHFDIGGKDILTYKELLQRYALFRGLRRPILVVPVLTPRLSSYWLFFITSTSFKLARALVGSLSVEMVCKDDRLATILGIQPSTFNDALEQTHQELEGKVIASSWKDSMVSGRSQIRVSDWLSVPTYGCFVDKRRFRMDNASRTQEKVWSIGGKTGWYYATWLWQVRGFIDQLVGGVGLRRGRTNPSSINPGDAIDFWRVLIADRASHRLLLFAEMKLPGEAWLEFSVKDGYIEQTATYRPKGIMGRLYWYVVYPMHALIFHGMAKRIAQS